MHNSVKSFSKQFNNYVQTFTDDFHTDMKWSFDKRDTLKEICFMLNISEKLISERISYCSLSLYDCSTTYFELFDALVILYPSWIPNGMKNMYACLFNVELRSMMCQRQQCIRTKEIASFESSNFKESLTKKAILKLINNIVENAS